MLAKVSDSLLSSASANPWEQDSVEIFLDQNNAKTTSYEADDGQFRVNYLNSQSFGGSANASRFVTAVQVVPGGYIVEAAMTLDGVEAQPGTLLGFDIQVNNDELGNGVRASVATWNDPTGQSFNNTSRLGVLQPGAVPGTRRSRGRPVAPRHHEDHKPSASAIAGAVLSRPPWAVLRRPHHPPA